ncbi:MAG: type IV secretion protein IcmB [Pseudobdellovibrionaceae bacterium]
MKFVESFLRPFQFAMKQALETFITLETSDDKTTLATMDGSLVSYVRVDGARQIIGEDEYNHIVQSATVKIGSRFDRAGHALQIYFVRDPSRIKGELERLVQPSRTTARNIGLEMDDVFEERARHLQKFLSYEECYFVLWTRPSSLSKAELDRIKKESKRGDKWVHAPNAQNPFGGLDALRTRHKSYVTAILSAMDELGVSCSLLEAHEALTAVKNNLFPSKPNNNWRACLPGDPLPPRAPTSTSDMSDILWPPLREQLAAGDAKVMDETVVQIGDLLWAGADVVLAPMDPTPFPQLLNRLFEAQVPYRISFLLEGGGAQAMQFRTFLATIFGVTNAMNRQIKFALEGLEAMSRTEPVVRLRISLATWAKRGEGQLVRDRLSTLVQAVESWGYCQVSEVSGDPLDCVMSSAMGIHCAGTAPAAVAPMAEVMKLLPWQRPSSPFDEGAIILRTPDGKVWPYQTGTNMTTTWFDLIFAQPGAGKSVLMNTLNLGTIVSPGLSKLPYVAIIDIGPSSSGLISLIKDALPPSRAHEAAYYRLQMSQEYAINPFDTQLGMRNPLQDERAYLIELMTLLCTPPGNEKAYDGISQLCGFVVDEMYRWRSDGEANAEARPYLPRIDGEVDEALRKHNVHLPTDPYWWDIVDKFFDLGLYHEANLAQRHAVPTLADAITAARRPQIRTLMEQTSIGSGAESVINAFERMITSSIREYPILSSVTRFEITDARVCSLDLMDVCPQGDDTADRQTSIMYMLARHALVRAWWMGPEALRFIPEKYRPFHELRLQDLAETPKRLCFDEFHRTSSSAAVRGQVIRDVREGRKRGVQIVLASQLLDDFDDDMVDLATGVWVLGTAVSENAVENVRQRFGLTETARNVIRYRLTGPRSSGAPALLILGTTDGRYEQHLINTLGPIELWALSTSAEDVAIRRRLYSKIGAARARRILATYFPGGSARSEIKRRVIAKSENAQGENRNAAVSAVIEEIVEELATASLKANDPGAASSQSAAQQKQQPQRAPQAQQTKPIDQNTT